MTNICSKAIFTHCESSYDKQRCQPQMSLFRNMNDTFQESGENFWKAAYFAINVVKNARTQDGLNIT